MRLLLRRVHRWAGLALAVPLILQGISGCILAAEPIFNSNTLTVAANGDETIDPAALVDAARAAAPARTVPRRYLATPGEATIVAFAHPGEQASVAQVFIDPGSGQVLAVGGETGGFVRWVHGLHENLLLGPQGRGIGGWVGIGLLILGLSGLPLWWPAPGHWRAGFTLQQGAKGLRFQRDLHGAAGIWAVAFLLLQSISGAALAFPQTARAIAGLPPMTQAGGRGRPIAAPSEPATALAPAIAGALRAVPDAALRELRLPAAAGRPVVAFLLPEGQREGAPQAIVLLDAAIGRVLSVQDPRRQGWGGWVLGWLRSLHYGAGLGLGWRLAICAAGLVLPLFPVTGLAMWLLRRRNRRRVALQRQDAMLGSSR